jgi:hypothetical protein
MKRTWLAFAALAFVGIAACETDTRDDIDRVEVTPAPAPAPAPMPIDTFPTDSPFGTDTVFVDTIPGS